MNNNFVIITINNIRRLVNNLNIFLKIFLFFKLFNIRVLINNLNIIIEFYAIFYNLFYR